MQEMTIGEVAHKAGIRPSAIRYYERIGLLPKAQRTNGRRRYEVSVLQKLGVIQMAQHAGFTMAEIQTLLHDFPADTPPSVRWQTLAHKKLTEIEALIQRANTMKTFLEQVLRCQCPNLDECVSVTENARTGEFDVKPCCGNASVVALSEIIQK